MTFQQIRYLLEIHRTGSVAAAAKALYLVPSSLSIAISNLEQELGCRIFERTRSGMIPTPEGLEIIHHANRIYASYCQILKPKQNERAAIRICGTEFAPTGDAFVRLIEENQDRTDITFSKTFGPYKLLNKKIIAGEADLLVLVHNESSLLSIQNNAKANGLAVKVLKKMPLSAAIGPGHRLYSKETVDYRELEHDRIADLSRSSVFSNQPLKNILPLRKEQALSVSDAQIQQKLVDKGLAYSIGAEFPTEETKARRLRYIRIGELNTVLIAVYNPALPMLPEVRRYLELLQEELDK